MALVVAGFYVNYQFVDNSGKSTHRRFQLAATDIAGATTAEGTLRPLVLALTDAKLKSYQLGVVYSEDALTLPAMSVQNENVGHLVMPIYAKPRKSATWDIPAVKDALFSNTTGPDADKIDMTNTDLLNFIAAIGNGGQAKISDGEVVTAVGARGERAHRKNRHG